jgi:hypothetical protein
MYYIVLKTFRTSSYGSRKDFYNFTEKVCPEHFRTFTAVFSSCQLDIALHEKKKRAQAGARVLTWAISQIPNVDPIASIQVKFSTHVSTKGLPANNKFPHTTYSKSQKKNE